MAHGAPDWTTSMIQLSIGGIPVAIAAGENYYYVKYSATAGENPTFTPSFSLSNVTITATNTISVKLNSTSNDEIVIPAGYYLTFDSFKVTNIFITNTSACTIEIFGTD